MRFYPIHQIPLLASTQEGLRLRLSLKLNPPLGPSWTSLSPTFVPSLTSPFSQLLVQQRHLGTRRRVNAGHPLKHLSPSLTKVGPPLFRPDV